MSEKFTLDALALSHYGLTDLIPKKVWLLVPDSKPIAHKDIRAFRTRNPKWKIGIEKNDGYSITNVERTIVEALVALAEDLDDGFWFGDVQIEYLDEQGE